MSRRAWIAVTYLSFSVWAAGATATSAKPPDLPAVPTIDCATGSTDTAAADSDAVTSRARKLYLQGEASLRAGYPVSAVLCYEQVRRLCPSGPYARLAAVRLAELGVVERPASMQVERDGEREPGAEEQSAVSDPPDETSAPAFGIQIVEESTEQQASQAVAAPPTTLYVAPLPTQLGLVGLPACCPLGQYLCQATDVIQRAICAEVDNSRPGRLPARLSLQLGGVEIHVELDAAGPGPAAMGVRRMVDSPAAAERRP